MTGRASAVLRVTPVLGRHRKRFAGAVAAATGATAGAVGVSAGCAWLVGLAVTGATSPQLWPPVLLVAAAVTVRVVCVWTEMWIAHDLAYRVMADIRVDIYDGLARLAPRWLLGRRSGDVGAAAMSDVESLEWFYAHAVAQTVVNVVTPLTALGVLAVVQPSLASALAGCAVLLLTVPWWLARRADRQATALRELTGELNADVVDGVHGLRELVLSGAGRRYAARVHGASAALARAQRSQAVRVGAENAVGETVVALSTVAMLLTAGVLVSGGDLDRAHLPLVVILASAVLAPVHELASRTGSLGLLRAAAGRAFAVVDARPHVVDRAVTSPAESVPHPPAVRFDSVDFRYEDDGPEVLRGAQLEIPAGATLALVGASGAGKSTCANLLLRFWDVDAGAVTVGGLDVRDLRQEDLRRLVAVVSQDAYLFHGTLAENIRLGRDGASDAEVRRAADQAQVTVFAEALPDGFDTVVGERGALLSGGQRQRVALARALLRDAPVLVLDEAVSNLDAENEATVREAVATARRGRTTLIIAHRLSTVRDADLVAVLEHGRVTQQGPPKDLLTAEGPFRRLLAGQLDDLSNENHYH